MYNMKKHTYKYLYTKKERWYRLDGQFRYNLKKTIDAVNACTMTKLKLVKPQKMWQKQQNHDHTLKMDTRSRSNLETLTTNLRSIEQCCLFLQHIFGHYRYQ